MNILNDRKFISGVESLIEPMEVSNLLFFQAFKRLLPQCVFKKLLTKASRKTPYIGFVIEPYSLFLFFKLKDFEKAKSLLPDRYELAQIKVFDDDKPDYYLGIGNLSTRASTFWGIRQESYLMATDKETGLLSWIFIDILSNTIIALPSKGIADPNSRQALFTTSSRKEVLLDIREDKTNRQLSLTGSIGKGRIRKLDQNLWLMGNTSIGHSKKLADRDDIPFAVIFDPAEVDEALDIPAEDIKITKNTLFPGLAESELCKVVCFPFAQHYIADSPGCHTAVKDRDDLINIYNRLGESDTIRTFSVQKIKTLFLIGIALSASVSLLLLILLIGT